MGIGARAHRCQRAEVNFNGSLYGEKSILSVKIATRELS